jgi:hypothetical protein
MESLTYLTQGKQAQCHGSVSGGFGLEHGVLQYLDISRLCGPGPSGHLIVGLIHRAGDQTFQPASLIPNDGPYEKEVPPIAGGTSIFF